jgi:uncharacterized membrane protein YedE/YeeE
MILRSLRLEDITVIKFMATTIAVATVVTYGTSYFLPMHFDIKPTYLLGVAGGGLLFGVGFALAGYCPGTCVVGCGEGRKDAFVALVGGLTGSLLFTFLYTVLEPLLIRPLNFGKIRLSDVLHVPAFGVALVLASILVAIVATVPTRRRGKRSPDSADQRADVSARSA